MPQITAAAVSRFSLCQRFRSAWLLFVFFAVAAHAFPPAPNYTIYGIVRDQVGGTLRVQGADLLLLREGVEIARTPVYPDPLGNYNYKLNISIDQNRSATRIYSSKAVPAQGVYSLAVTINGETFYPIETRGTLRVGNGGERVRFDLTLGADTNNDGLPDAWQEWVLYQAGRAPGGPGWDLALITKDGDFDGDGISNYDEYLAGTYAGDATERFELRITGKTSTVVNFEFFAITGKIYAIEASADLKTWTQIPFSVVNGGSAATYYPATSVGVLPASVAVSAGSSHFYRLTVR